MAKNSRRVRNSNPLENVSRTALTLADLTDAMIASDEKNTPQEIGGELVIATPEGRIQVGRFLMTPLGLENDGSEISLPEWEQFGIWLNNLRDSIQWIIGDWANIAADNIYAWLPEEIENHDQARSKYQILITNTGYSYSSVTKFAHYADRIPIFRRRKNLSYSHHVEVADLAEDRQEYFLDMAEQKGLSVRELREMIRGDTEKEVSEDPFQVENFKKGASDLAKLIGGVGEGKSLSDKKARVALDNIEMLRAWLDSAEAMVRNS